MKFTKSITFDMDGTLADFYGVENWVDYLNNGDTTPYKNAKPLFNFQVLARLLNRLQKQGYSINIVSWGSKGGTSDYLKEVEKVKKAWLDKHLHSVTFDNIIIAEYGVSKREIMKNSRGILFDDNEEVRADWNGISFSEKDILEILKALVR